MKMKTKKKKKRERDGEREREKANLTKYPSSSGWSMFSVNFVEVHLFVYSFIRSFDLFDVYAHTPGYPLVACSRRDFRWNLQ